MIMSEDSQKRIKEEYSIWINNQYAGKSKKERQLLSQFFTPPEVIIKMIEMAKNLKGNILDPTCGCGGLLAGAILAGADPKLCYGIEIDPVILEICRERLCKLGVPYYNIHLGNALNNDCYDHFDDSYEYNIEEDKVYIKDKPITIHKQDFSFGYF